MLSTLASSDSFTNPSTFSLESVSALLRNLRVELPCILKPVPARHRLREEARGLAAHLLSYLIIHHCLEDLLLLVHDERSVLHRQAISDRGAPYIFHAYLPVQ